MKTYSHMFTACVLACTGLAVLLTGCPEERDPITRVQPYALKKAWFVGEDYRSTADDPEFWSQNTLIDVGYGAKQNGLFTSTYAQPMSRVKWQITEDLLIARLAYERIDTSDGKGVGGATQDGVIVAAFTIERHFDIINEYNPTTGEKLNILGENTTDRPWYERDYMRVDWSKSLNTDSYDFDTLSLLGVYGSIVYEPLSYFVEDPNDRDAPFFEVDQQKLAATSWEGDSMEYFDVTTKAFAKPGVIDLSSLGWGIDAFPSCFLDNDFMGGSSPSGSCSPVEITLRHSFRRVQDNDYDPVDWDGFRFQSYGGFYVERSGYARNYGMSDDLWHRFLARYQIWERSHYYDNPEAMTGAIECYTPETTPFGADPHRDEDGNGTEDECEAAGAGSKCNTFSQKCTLPYAERTARPIVWYYTNESNLDFYTPTADAAHEWDVAMRMAVATARYAECKKVGDGDCATKYPVYFGQQTDNVDAIQLARDVDHCRHTGGSNCEAIADDLGGKRGVSAGVIAIAKMPEMVLMCHSPVEAGDPAGCGEARLPEGITSTDCFNAREQGHGDADNDELLATCNAALNVRKGDLRYHQVNVITEPQTPSPWGIYTDAEDPLTGETISASINVWSHVNDLWAQGVIDTMRFINGELSESEVTEGEYIHRYAEAYEAAQKGSAVPKLSREEVERRTREFAAASLPLPESGEAAEAAFMSLPEAGQTPMLPDGIMKKARELKQEMHAISASLDTASAMRPIYSARRNALKGSNIEAQLMTKPMQELWGIEGMAMTEGLLDIVSPMRGGNPTLQRDLYNMKQNALAKQGACVMHEAPAPLAVASLAKVLQQKFGNFDPNQSEGEQIARANKMQDYLRRQAHYAVIVHEMGHSIGLRHNFVSSSDAWGYRPQYWQLRTKNGTVTTECTQYNDDGSACVGPRYYDPVTTEEQDNLIWMWSHSSVMDYAGELAQDTLGLGAYDFAAAKMFYGDVVAVFEDASYRSEAGNNRANGMLAKLDNFGGILGISYQAGETSQGPNEFHYSQLHNNFELIKDCATVNPEDFKPTNWNEELDGVWSPLLDGLIVQVDGQYTRCRQQPVDYVRWNDLRMPGASDPGPGFYRGGPSIDGDNRIRVPYGFATDRWADLGNLSVYRHDNGADAYELFDFLITQQEVGHIFDNYRRRRNGFSVRSASNRTLSRYNTKMRDGAKGLGLLRNIYQDFALENLNYEFDTFWQVFAPLIFRDNILASGLAFDHFARQAARPEVGPHFLQDGVLLSSEDAQGAGSTVLNVPNGATGLYGNITYGGKLVENRLASDKGEYDAEFTINAGSYYDKINTAMLFTESVDNFISSSRTDFTDPRYRAVSLADLFPEGYRRWLANNLTDDVSLKGARVAATSSTQPETDADGYPARGIGWTTWWGRTPTTCFPAENSTVCQVFGETDNSVLGQGGGAGPSFAIPVDPQMGWEQQKFLVAWTMMYLPENQQQRWINMMRMWELGVDADPEFSNRIELHHPDGKLYVAKTYGKEQIFGKIVQRGIAARVLEYANELLNQAYNTTDGPDIDGNGQPDWFVPVISPNTGLPVIKYDPSVTQIDPATGFTAPQGTPGCNATNNDECSCSQNRACMKLQEYMSLPFFMREALDAYMMGDPKVKGIW